LPFEYVGTPPITHLLMAILGYCRIGGSFAPGVRQLSEMSGVTLGLISGLLYDLDRAGWIAYDGHVIMVLRDLDSDDQLNRDQLIADQLIADSLISDEESPSSALESGDQNPDRSDRHMVDSCLVAVESDSTATRSKIPCGAKNDQPHDQHAADLVMAEYGVFVTLRKQALLNRPDLTPQQVRDTYAHFKPAIDAGRCTDRAFFKAIALGEIYPAPPDPARPLDPQAYAADPAYQLGSALPDEAARRNALYRDAHWRAVDLLGPGAAFGDMRIVVEALVDGATDDQALAELARELSEVKR